MNIPKEINDYLSNNECVIVKISDLEDLLRLFNSNTDCYDKPEEIDYIIHDILQYNGFIYEE